MWLGIGAVMALVSVAAGAFGAHGLRETLEPRAMEIFETAARYQMYHALGLIAIGMLARGVKHRRWLNIAGFAMLVGIVVFCGSLYGLALGAPSILGAVAPIGGTAFMLGWLALAVFAFGGRGSPAIDGIRP